MCSIRVGFFIANLTYYIASIEVAVCTVCLNAHWVSYLCKCFVCPSCTTSGANPVFDVAVPSLTVSTCFCFNVYDIMCSIRIGFFIANLTYYIARIEVAVTCSWYNNVHLVSYLCACFIKPCGATIGAIPVFYITVVYTVSCFCINMY